MIYLIVSAYAVLFISIVRFIHVATFENNVDDDMLEME